MKATGGSLTTSISLASQIKGTFEFDAIGTVFENPEQQVSLTVTGEFTAKPVGSGALRMTSLKIQQSR